MNLYWVVLIIILCLDIFLICKCLNLSGQLITLVSSDYPDIWEQFGRPLPGFISPNPFKARRLERFMMTKGLNTHKLNEKVTNKIKKLKKFKNFHYSTYSILLLFWFVYLAI